MHRCNALIGETRARCIAHTSNHNSGIACVLFHQPPQVRALVRNFSALKVADLKQRRQLWVEFRQVENFVTAQAGALEFESKNEYNLSSG